MRPKLSLILILSFALSACSALARPRVPNDAQDISFTSVVITVSTRRDERIEGGFYTGGIYDPGYLVGNGYQWSDGSDSTVTIGVTNETVQRIVGSLIDEFGDVEAAYTYSEHFSGAERNTSLGMYTSDYLALSNKIPLVSITLTGVKEDYNRSMWINFPMEDVDSTLWDRLNSALPNEGRFLELVSGLHTYWENNT